MVAESMKKVLTVLWVLLAFSLACNLANAYSETVKVAAGGKEERDVGLSDGDSVSGRVTLVAQAINFSISDPDGAIILSYTVSGPVDFQFTASKAGTYVFHFENSFSDVEKSVTFNYNAQHYIFGFPQEYIILFAIVGLALVAVVVFAAMSPKP